MNSIHDEACEHGSLGKHLLAVVSTWQACRGLEQLEQHRGIERVDTARPATISVSSCGVGRLNSEN